MRCMMCGARRCCTSHMHMSNAHAYARGARPGARSSSQSVPMACVWVDWVEARRLRAAMLVVEEHQRDGHGADAEGGEAGEAKRD
mmetsp:Transcript_59883/g.118907  ORF Transcript_59883/g.118907 Transcript_59883/m.118907 type:complete len:85 (-) Transcript_59883:307-561(-)